MSETDKLELIKALCEHLSEEIFLYSKTNDLAFSDMFYGVSCLYSHYLNNIINAMHESHSKEMFVEYLLNATVNNFLEEKNKVKIYIK